MTSATAAPERSYLEHKVAMYRSQVALRVFEKRAYDLFLENLVKGTSHLSLGQEAIAAGFAAAMRPTDWTFSTYRGHDHTLARGVPMTPVMAELLGRANGLMAGKGGSMHLASVEHGVWGVTRSSARICPSPAAPAWSRSTRNRASGGLLLRRRHDEHRRLPRGAQLRRDLEAAGRSSSARTTCGWSTRATTDVTAVANPAADRAAPTDSNRSSSTATTPMRVFEVARHGVRARAARRRAELIEALTYRHGGHSRADPGKYRPDAEVAEWLAKDPIPLYRSRLLDDGRRAKTNSPSSRPTWTPKSTRRPKRRRTAQCPAKSYC